MLAFSHCVDRKAAVPVVSRVHLPLVSSAPPTKEDLPAVSGVGSTAVGGRRLVVLWQWGLLESRSIIGASEMCSVRGLAFRNQAFRTHVTLCSTGTNVISKPLTIWQAPQNHKETHFMTSSTTVHHRNGIASSLQNLGTHPGCISRLEPPGHVTTAGHHLTAMTSWPASLLLI